jgi:ribonuclease R
LIRAKHKSQRRSQKTSRPSPSRSHSTSTRAKLPASAEGVVSANRNGFGFVRVEGLESDIFLPAEQMSGIVHGDRVRVSIRRDSGGRYSGRLEAVLERAVQAFLATVERIGKDLWVRAADRRLNLHCVLDANGTAGALPGDWVIAELATYPSEAAPGRAKVRLRLDPERPVQLATETAIARFGLNPEFSAAAQSEAQRWGQQVNLAEAGGRVDLRTVPLVTIDGEDARDFDDAVYAERREGGGFRLLVAIADVSHYVGIGSALDLEARARGTSVYFPNRVLPMLPTALSDRLCSLQPEVERLCMVADMQVSARGALGEVRCYPAVMRSAARLTYTQAHAALFAREPGARAALGALAGHLEPLVEIYQVLQKARARRGALNFESPEAKFRFESGELVHAIDFVPRNDAHKLIEECMVLANVAVARYLHRAQVPALYRVHAPPEERKLEALRATLKVLGMQVTLGKELKTADLAAIAPRVRDEMLRPFIESLVIRSLSQAVYQPENIGHFGLALHEYAHFTSPIRRYPDLLIHRALRGALGLVPLSALPNAAQLAGLGADLSRLEKRADEADRYVDTFLKCVYLRDRIGQSFEGVITTVVEFGCFVQLPAVGIDGLLHLTALEDYQLARDGARWLGRRGGAELAPGGRLRVVVTAVKPVEGMVDLELVTD